ncbi:MAG: type IV pilus modification protein PilV [Methylococcaceae bacterium]
MNKNAGFTLIEVLIAMVVLAVGLLGLAGLQVTSLRNNQSAYNRSQATQLAYELADRMRANAAGQATYTAILPSSATAKATCLTTSGCSPAEMAENDLFEWNRAVKNNLPSGIGTLPPPSAKVYTISITWDDDRDGNDTNNLNFQTRFQL